MAEEWIAGELEALRADSLERSLTVFAGLGGRLHAGGGEPLLNFASNDYLNLSGNAAVISAAVGALKAFGAGATASRLLAGTRPIHEELERELAAYKGCEAALVFPSGYAANAGTIPVLAGRGDRVFADRLAHASILDAALLGRARLHRFRHNDPAHLECLLRAAPAAARKLVVTESVFSMDGDLAPLEDIAEVALKRKAMLMVDEAHALGVFGHGGAGLVRTLGLEKTVNVSMGTLSKALGSQGGFVACSRNLRDLLVNRSRAFIYTTGLAPAAAAAALAALRIVSAQADPGKALLERAELLRDRLRRAGLDTGGSRSQIVPVIVGQSERAMFFSNELRKLGILAPAIRPPTVPSGSARLRLSLTLAHSEEDVLRLAGAIAQIASRAPRASTSCPRSRNGED